MVHHIKWLFLFRLSLNIIFLTFLAIYGTKSITFPYMRDVCFNYYYLLNMSMS